MSSQFDVVYIQLDVFDEGSKFVNTRLGGLQIQDYIIVLRFPYFLNNLYFSDYLIINHKFPFKSTKYRPQILKKK